jgi:soluble lytic murein transglycosylase-like protein
MAFVRSEVVPGAVRIPWNQRFCLPKAMKKNCIEVPVRIGAILVAAMLTVLVPPTRAQIASHVNDRGKLVYTNNDSNLAPNAGTMSSTASANASKLAAQASPSAPPAHLQRVVHEVAERHSIDPALVSAVISTESGWNPFAISRKGAVGLMQLIPGTAERFGVGNPFDPVQNIEGGTMYLKALLNRYNGNLEKSLAAYNAGEHAVDLSGGVPRNWETQRYVRKVTDAYFRPGSGRDLALWEPPKDPVRKEVDARGRVVFTNE